MNNLLLFFALPVATIILSIVFQKIIMSPVLVAISFFAIYLVVAFSFFSEMFLIYAIAYTILSYSTAVITRFVFKLINCQNRINNTFNNFNELNNSSNSSNDIMNLNELNYEVSSQSNDINYNQNGICSCMRNNYYRRRG